MLMVQQKWRWGDHMLGTFSFTQPKCKTKPVKTDPAQYRQLFDCYCGCSLVRGVVDFFNPATHHMMLELCWTSEVQRHMQCQNVQRKYLDVFPQVCGIGNALRLHLFTKHMSYHKYLPTDESDSSVQKGLISFLTKWGRLSDAQTVSCETITDGVSMWQTAKWT